jgi:hypothetical protein
MGEVQLTPAVHLDEEAGGVSWLARITQQLWG